MALGLPRETFWIIKTQTLGGMCNAGITAPPDIPATSILKCTRQDLACHAHM
jgi:hypothetical protein